MEAFDVLFPLFTPTHETILKTHPHFTILLPKDIGSLTFTDSGDPEAERFLRDFMVNRRWSSRPQTVPSYEEVIDAAAVGSNEEADLGDDGLEQSDDGEFLVKAGGPSAGTDGLPAVGQCALSWLCGLSVCVCGGRTGHY